ncbi:MAG TPA: hypothetical protein VFI14_00960 [Chryseosolibacter sp.]|nr:hypothetical protein [Chryseosolibacter sp.]
MKDYHFLSLEQKIGPMFLSMDKEEIGHLNNMMVKLPATNLLKAGSWTTMSPGNTRNTQGG